MHTNQQTGGASEGAQAEAKELMGVVIRYACDRLTVRECRELLARALDAARAAAERERDEAISRIPTVPPSVDPNKLILNAYGRRCYDAGADAARAEGQQRERADLIAKMMELQRKPGRFDLLLRWVRVRAEERGGAQTSANDLSLAGLQQCCDIITLQGKIDDLRGALEWIVRCYDSYRGKGVAPAPEAYQALVDAIERARGWLRARAGAQGGGDVSL